MGSTEARNNYSALIIPDGWFKERSIALNLTEWIFCLKKKHTHIEYRIEKGTSKLDRKKQEHYYELFRTRVFVKKNHAVKKTYLWQPAQMKMLPLGH